MPASDAPFPFWDEARRADPYAFYAALRRDRPVVRATVPGRGDCGGAPTVPRR